MLSSFSFSSTSSFKPRKALATNERLAKLSTSLYQLWRSDEGSSIKQLGPLLKTISGLRLSYPSLLRSDVVFGLHRNLALIQTMLVSELSKNPPSEPDCLAWDFSKEDCFVFPTLTEDELDEFASIPNHIVGSLFNAIDRVNFICSRFAVPTRNDEEASKERRQLHLEFFEKINIAHKFPLPSALHRDENSKVLSVVTSMLQHKAGPFAISPVIDHWTTLSNFRSIIHCQAFYGNDSLTQGKITFTKNALGIADEANLDGDVICFCPGGFVDHAALTTMSKGRDSHIIIRPELIRVRIDLRKVEKTSFYNTFFKLVDLCLESFSINMKITDDFSISITKTVEQELNFLFRLGDKTEMIQLQTEDLIYYGDYNGFNRISLLLLFIVLDKCQNQSFVNQVYQYLASMHQDDLQRAIICFAQNATCFAEYNFNSSCSLTPGLIYDMHVVASNRTYHLHRLSEPDYNQALTDIVNEAPLSPQIQVTKEQIASLTKTGLQLYGKEVLSLEEDDSSAHFGTLDVRQLPRWKLEDGYIETRPGTRSVPFLSAQLSEKSASVHFAFQRKSGVEQKTSEKAQALALTSRKNLRMKKPL